MKRRQLLTVAALGSIGAVVVANQAFGATTPTGASASAFAAVAANADVTVEPTFGAGIFDVDPAQGLVSQTPGSVVTGNVTALPHDWGF